VQKQLNDMAALLDATSIDICASGSSQDTQDNVEAVVGQLRKVRIFVARVRTPFLLPLLRRCALIDLGEEQNINLLRSNGSAPSAEPVPFTQQH
jgi:hypothetical protein